tara:strand:+ start:8164 stop:8673 length:510 start_codon:yes stop_codon:yes gene_type:complete
MGLGFQAAGAQSGRDMVFKTWQYHEDPVYILYDQAMSLLSGVEQDSDGVKDRKKKQIKPILKKLYDWYFLPMLKRVESVAGYEEYAPEYAEHIKHQSQILNLQYVSTGDEKKQPSGLEKGYGEKMYPYMQDVVDNAWGLIDGPNQKDPSSSVQTGPPLSELQQRQALGL